eukprot:3542154-Rhodomonas_salina.6
MRTPDGTFDSAESIAGWNLPAEGSTAQLSAPDTLTFRGHSCDPRVGQRSGAAHNHIMPARVIAEMVGMRDHDTLCGFMPTERSDQPDWTKTRT